MVVEPDVRNEAVHALNADVGFVPAERVRLDEKEALLSFCTRADWERAARDHDARRLADHLEPGNWAQANRAMVAKAIAEFAHERLLAPERRARGPLVDPQRRRRGGLPLRRRAARAGPLGRGPGFDRSRA